MLRVLITALLLLCIQYTDAQDCTAQGQRPDRAIPICGVVPIVQNPIPICMNGVVRTCENIRDFNPYWYKFTCYNEGTLSFKITPNVLTDDYDWVLFDMTYAGSPFDVYNDPSLFVAANYSATPGITGALSGYNTIENCLGPGGVPIIKYQYLLTGHKYLLLVAHYTPTPDGFTLLIEPASTATIGDQGIPQLKDARTYCDGSKIVVRLKNKIKCSSITATGSEFTLSPPNATVVGAMGMDCGTGVETDSIQVSLSGPLPAGNYTLTIKDGTDNNTMTTPCDKAVPIGAQVGFVAAALPAFGIDSLKQPGCSPDFLDLVVNGNLAVNSIAFDGSDFMLTGPSPQTITAASPVFNSSVTSKVIRISLAAKISVQGTYTLSFKNGFDGNTILDECGQSISPGTSFNFEAKDSVHAAFDYTIKYGCRIDTVNYFVLNNSNITDYRWTFDNIKTSSLPALQMFYSTDAATRYVKLSVTNGACTDTASISLVIANALKAKFETTDLLCPGDPAFIKESSIGDIAGWYWDLGNGGTSTLREPAAQYYTSSNITRLIPVQLIVTGPTGCKDSMTKKIKLVSSCVLAVPNAFTPNNDGLNDWLYPVNAYKATGLSFSVYNRFGQLVFSTKNGLEKWNGDHRGQPAEPGTYVWKLDYTDIDTKKTVHQQGTAILIR